MPLCSTTPSPAPQAGPDEDPVVAAIASAYLAAAGGDARAALGRVIVDALTDLCEAERRTLRRDRLISHGYVRGVVERTEFRP